MTTARASLFALVMSALSPCMGVAQCRAADSATAARLAQISKMMASTDAREILARQSYRLPVVADTAIAVVTDSNICARAANAYNESLRTAAQVAGRKVYVIRIGPCRFMVWDVPTSDRLSDAYEVVAVLDETFSVLASFAAIG